MEEWVWGNGGMILTGENWSPGRKTLHRVGGRWMNEYGAMVEWRWHDNAKLLGKKSVPLPHCVPQILHGQDWHWNWTCMTRDLLLTSEPYLGVTFYMSKLISLNFRKYSVFHNTFSITCITNLALSLSLSLSELRLSISTHFQSVTFPPPSKELYLWSYEVRLQWPWPTQRGSMMREAFRKIQNYRKCINLAFIDANEIAWTHVLRKERYEAWSHSNVWRRTFSVFIERRNACDVFRRISLLQEWSPSCPLWFSIIIFITDLVGCYIPGVPEAIYRG